MHLVFMRNDIKEFSSAHSIPNALTVVGVLFDVSYIPYYYIIKLHNIIYVHNIT